MPSALVAMRYSTGPSLTIPAVLHVRRLVSVAELPLFLIQALVLADSFRRRRRPRPALWASLAVDCRPTLRLETRSAGTTASTRRRNSSRRPSLLSPRD